MNKDDQMAREIESQINILLCKQTIETIIDKSKYGTSEFKE